MKRELLFLVVLFIGIYGYAQQITENIHGQNVTQSIKNEVRHYPIYPESEMDTLWKQFRSYASSESLITSSHFDLGNFGLYAADDFKLETTTMINGVFFQGSQAASDGLEQINGIDIYIYSDDNGKPSGNPTIQDSEIHKITNIQIQDVVIEDDEEAFLGRKMIFIDLAEQGNEFSLDSGTYWISIILHLELEDIDLDIRWLGVDKLLGYQSQYSGVY